jgi:hypothetical protein
MKICHFQTAYTFILLVSCLFQFVCLAPQTSQTTSDKSKIQEPNLEHLEGQLLHKNSSFIHGNEPVDKQPQKLNISDPSVVDLEKKIEIAGHENEKVNNNNNNGGRLNISEPSSGDLEDKIKIGGHENDKEEVIADKMKNPSLEYLEEKIKISGHENDKKEVAGIMKNPSIESLEEKIKISGHDNEQKSDVKVKNMEPSMGDLDGELLHANPKFRHEKKEKGAITTVHMNLSNMEPSNDLLENQIKVNHSDNLVNETARINRIDILPNYEGAHGVMMSGDETYVRDASNDSRTLKPADLDDFKTWMANEDKSSKLNRFKRLAEEFSNLNKHMDDHDFQVINDNLNALRDGKNPGEKLASVIKELEEEETRKRKFKKAKMDL